jgi:hypothetical protein
MNAPSEFLPDPLPEEPLAVPASGSEPRGAPAAQSRRHGAGHGSADGRPAARVVLCRDIVPQPGFLVFTNYLSMKASN